MAEHSSIGPVDPQINGIPCVGVVDEVKKAYSDIKKDQRWALVWDPILRTLSPAFYQQCEWAIENSKMFLKKVLEEGMLRELPTEKRNDTVKRVTEWLTDLSHNKNHDRHIHYQECSEIGLRVELIEDSDDEELQEKILTVHHCFMHTLSNTDAYKAIENHQGTAYIKLQQPQPPGGLQIQLPVVKQP